MIFPDCSTTSSSYYTVSSYLRLAPPPNPPVPPVPPLPPPLPAAPPLPPLPPTIPDPLLSYTAWPGTTYCSPYNARDHQEGVDSVSDCALLCNNRPPSVCNGFTWYATGSSSYVGCNLCPDCSSTDSSSSAVSYARLAPPSPPPTCARSFARRACRLLRGGYTHRYWYVSRCIAVSPVSAIALYRAVSLYRDIEALSPCEGKYTAV